MRFLLLAIILLIPFRIWAFENIPVGARSAGMSDASVVNIDIWALQNNQGALGFYDKLSLSVHHENRFLTEKFGFKTANFTLPTGTGNFGFSYSFFGESTYNEKKIGIAYAKSLWKKVSFGVQLDYLHTQQIQQYGNSGTVTADLGMLVLLTDQISLGAHVFNPTAKQVESINGLPTPTIIRMGMGYSLPEQLTVNAEIEKDLNFRPFIKIGSEYQLYEGLLLRAGISNQSMDKYNHATNSVVSSYSFGIGYVKFNTRADIAFMSHPDIGFTPHFSICYEIK